jgi:hypothetical protein
VASFQYRVYGRPITPADEIWHRPIPQDRRGTGGDGEAPFTHGDYFETARAFLEGEARESLRAALSEAGEDSVPEERIGTLCIDLKKHGAFYHPARVTADGFASSFVLNLAVSAPGRGILDREYDLLARLNRLKRAEAIPEVYARGSASTGNDRPVRLFLGEWFSGYREFHLSEDEAENRRMIVWDDDRGNFYLSPETVADLYRQVAGILTDLYDAESFDQVHPWHHGAGDFVVKPGEGSVSVKLITVRGYGSAMADPGEGDPASLLQGLLLFLLNLSIWTRLDRLDGVGEVVWSDPMAVGATVTGFFDALSRKPVPAVLPDTLSRCFRAFLSVCDRADLMAVAQSLVDAYPDGAPEVPVVRAHLDAHIEDLHGALAGFI